MMKKVLCLLKSITSEQVINSDPSYYVGRQFVFDEFYLVTVLSFNNDYFTVKIQMDDIEQIDKIYALDFFSHIKNNIMLEKVDSAIFEFHSLNQYIANASHFLLKNYNVVIDDLDFDWKMEFKNLTPVEIACKLAMGIFKK